MGWLLLQKVKMKKKKGQLNPTFRSEEEVFWEGNAEREGQACRGTT